MYRTLSEAKTEIENVIKSGRKLCDDGSTKNPQKLSIRIDTLKHLFNTLGENVTKSKAILEKLIKTSNQFNVSIENVFKWISKQKRERLDNSENLEEKPLNISTIQDAEKEVLRCHELYDEYKSTVDPVYLEDIKEKLNLVDREFYDVYNSDVLKTLQEMMNTLQNMDNVSVDSLRFDIFKITILSLK